MAERKPPEADGVDPISRLGGLALYEKHGAEHMRRIGEKGRRTVRKRYGLRFYSEIARRRKRQNVPEKADDAA